MTLSLLPPLFEVPPATTVVFNAEFDENSSIHELFVQEVVALNAPNFSMPTEVVQKKVFLATIEPGPVGVNRCLPAGR